MLIGIFGRPRTLPNFPTKNVLTLHLNMALPKSDILINPMSVIIPHSDSCQLYSTAKNEVKHYLVIFRQFNL